MSRVRLLVALIAVLSLGAGYLLGRALHAPPPPPPTYLEQLADAVDLRPDQVERVAAILEDEDHALSALLAAERPAVAAAVSERRDLTEERIVAVLDDAQRRRYEELVAGALTPSR